MTALVHPDNRSVAEQAVRVMGFTHGGVDFITPDITRSCFEVGGAVNEVNSKPGLVGHQLLEPTRCFEEDVLARMGKLGGSRIPVVAVAGSSPQPDDVLALHGVFGPGETVGMSTGVDRRVAGCRIGTRLRNSVVDAQAVLLSDVSAAVLALNVDDIAHDGTPFDACDVVVLLPWDGGDAPDEAQSAAIANLLSRARRGVVLDPHDPQLQARLRLSTGRMVMLAHGTVERANAVTSLLHPPGVRDARMCRSAAGR